LKTSRHTARWPLRYAAFPDNYRLQIITKRSLFAGEMYSTICADWVADYFGLRLT